MNSSEIMVRIIIICVLTSILFLLVALGIIKNRKRIIGSLINALKGLYRIAAKMKRFFTNKKFLLSGIVFNVIYVVAYIVFWGNGNKIPMKVFLLIPFATCSIMFIYYCDQFFAWCERSHETIGRIVSRISDCLVFAVPSISFFSLVQEAKMYYEGARDHSILVLVGIMIFMQIPFMVYYCGELKDINSNRFSMKYRVKLFLFLVIHIIQMFASVYMLFLIIDPNAISGITANSPIELGFDLTYFSAMTFLGQDGILEPASHWTKIIVLAESCIFAIYISSILLGMLSGSRTERCVAEELLQLACKMQNNVGDSSKGNDSMEVKLCKNKDREDT